jgi:hypothetical protein
MAGACISIASDSSRCPSGRRADHRRMLAMQSAGRTGVPSWKMSPSRSVNRQVSRSSDNSWPAAICGCGTNRSSRPYSMSKTIMP